MSQAYEKTMFLFEEYSDRIVYGSEQEDEALQNAVDWVFRDRTDDFRSDLYARIKETWDACTIEGRFVYTQQIIEQEVVNG
ncbi:hypothetical protein [Xylella phage Cota]|uniref:Uncharacterized protein n=1 Tax=Xylella phage Cota TaxID=2699877 RepID=A0A6F8ZK51_9CAUD|nr:hypothetical protein [Xylella phage Cota]